MSAQNFIKFIVEETNGFQLDEAWRVSEESLSVIVPVKRNSDSKRDYITFAEAQDVKVEDTGQIDSVYVKNNEDKPLLISRGEIFRGKTQERAAIHGYIVGAGRGMKIAVRCIHQTKGISKGAEMKYGGYTPYDVDFSNQSRTWSTVRQANSTHKVKTKSFKSPSPVYGDAIPVNNIYYSGTITESPIITANSCTTNDFIGGEVDYSMSSNSELGSSRFTATPTSSDDLVGTLDEMSDMIKEMLKRIPPIENQVGAIFLYENEIRGLDVYDLPDSWKSVKDDVVEKEGSNYLKKDDTNLFEFKAEKVKALLGKRLNTIFEEKTIFDNKEYKVIEIKQILPETEDKNKTKRLMGEAVEFNGNIIHLTMYRA
jgi:hypothetical protein